jgi:quinol monooxygenase YgiN
MPRITLVRYTTHPEKAQENETLTRAVFDALRKTQPADIAYALFRDGDAFTHLFVNRAEDSAAPLADLPAFQAFQAGVAQRTTAPPEVIRLNPALLESYGLKS